MDRLLIPTLFVGGLLLAACGGGGGNKASPVPANQTSNDAPVFPTDEWASATPAEMNMDVAKLDQARNYSLSGGGAGLITRHGRVVYSWGDTTARYDLKSATKSIGSIALGLALDDGRVRLEDPAQLHLPTFGVPPNRNASTGWLDQVTILQLATHTAGFEKSGGYGALEFKPGTTWLYSDGGVNWLADVLTQVYGEDLNTLLFSRVWSPIGITDARETPKGSLFWRENAQRDHKLNGVERREVSSGIEASVDAMARIGYLFLRRGAWDGQRLLSESFVDTVRTPRAEVANTVNADATDFPDENKNIGVLWRTNTEGDLPDVPRDAYWGHGLGDNLIIVIPSLDMVIARTGNDPDDPTLPQLRTHSNDHDEVVVTFLTPIVQSVTDD
ncbi:MAG TPA: serine hydrolase [Steroidobacteraceae bacterium]|nr:serine hydrolase [Steroidobacteraceae bacterium]